MKKRAAFLIGTGCVLLTASLSLFASNQVQSVQAAKSVDALTNSFQSDLHSVSVEESGTDVAGIQVQSDNPGSFSALAITNQTTAKSVVIDGQEYIGLLSIPSLGLNLPVNKDISYPLMRATPCRYYGDAETDSLIIAAHNYNSHFGRIGTLNPGDKVTFTDANGKTETYAVSAVQTLPGNAVDEMIKHGDWDLTLFTCNYSGAQRITVRCVKEAAAEIYASLE